MFDCSTYVTFIVNIITRSEFIIIILVNKKIGYASTLVFFKIPISNIK